MAHLAAQVVFLTLFRAGFSYCKGGLLSRGLSERLGKRGVHKRVKSLSDLGKQIVHKRVKWLSDLGKQIVHKRVKWSEASGNRLVIFGADGRSQKGEVDSGRVGQKRQKCQHQIVERWFPKRRAGLKT